jgi:hypothetical protein
MKAKRKKERTLKEILLGPESEVSSLKGKKREIN